MQHRSGVISRRTFLGSMILAAGASAGCATAAGSNRKRSKLIGYTRYRTNLPTRFANQITMRAHVVGIDGSSPRPIAESLTAEPNSWTQFAGWTPDGRQAVIGRGWETPENAAWEEENKTFRMTQDWLYDTYFLDMTSGNLVNLTAVERVSNYNAGIIFVPDDNNTLGFTALINGISHPFLMDRDGRNKRDVSQGKDGFSYGFSASPDGRFIAYHKDYQVYVANKDGSEPKQIDTGNPFNFCPLWSPSGEWLMFVSGEHYNCHPTIVHPDGTGLRKLADRGGYEGVTPVIDVFDFHGGSSDVPVWSIDGASIYYTARVNDAIELMRVSVDGRIEQLTRSKPGVAHYHPKPSPDGKYLAFGSNESGPRRLYVSDLDAAEPQPITPREEGFGAMWLHWQP
ncbi:MAG: hypothetical protein K1Y02_16530 [Candidatus Hydrogenedentes bacterium]|nr:hypothetical protein [Candidatus Hydrogenedentota bacterium]